MKNKSVVVKKINSDDIDEIMLFLAENMGIEQMKYILFKSNYKELKIIVPYFGSWIKNALTLNTAPTSKLFQKLKSDAELKLTTIDEMIEYILKRFYNYCYKNVDA